MQGSAAGQPVATLVKAVTTQAGTSLPSMTIPVSTVNLHNVNISVSMPQQKAGATATKQLTAQQIRGLQLQQLQQQQRKTSQLQQQQKVAGMSSTFLGSGGGRMMGYWDTWDIGADGVGNSGLHSHRRKSQGYTVYIFGYQIRLFSGCLKAHFAATLLKRELPGVILYSQVLT